MKKEPLHYGAICKSWCLRHKCFAAFLAVQPLVVLYFVALLFAPKISLSLPLDSFVSSWQPEAVTLDEAGLSVQNDAEITDAVVLLSQPIALTKGAYTVTVDYDSMTDPTNRPNDIRAYSVALYCEKTLVSGQTQSDLLLLLRDAAQSLEGRIWNDGSETQTSLMLYYSGTGVTNISRIQIEEQGAWRWVQLLCVCLGFALLDLLIAFFLGTSLTSCPKARACREKTKTFLLLLGIAFVASLPFFVDHIYYGDDVSFHLTRIVSLASELASGQFPVRMMTNMINGYGYASSIFYCDILLYLPAVLYNCMLPLQTAYHTYIFCINLATAAIAYYSFKQIAKDASIGLVGAFVYTLASYRLTNVYTRAAVGEYSAMAFFPLVALGLWRIYQTEKPRYSDWLPLTLGMAGILQTHLLSVEMTVGFVALVCLVLLKQTLQGARFKSFVLAVLLCLGLCAWFWVPFLQSYLSLDLLAGEIMLDVNIRAGVQPWQMLALYASNEGAGYNTMPLMLGWALLAGVGIALYYLLRRHSLQAKDTKQYCAMRLALCLGVLASVFALDAFPWVEIGTATHVVVLQAINTIQFPWRFLAIATICFVVASVLALCFVKQYHPNAYQGVCAVLMGLTLVTMGLFYTDFVQVTDTGTKDTLDIADCVIVWGEYMMEGSIEGESYYSYVATSSEDVRVEEYYKQDGVAYLTCQNTSDQVQSVALPIYAYPNYQAVDLATGEGYDIAVGENNRITLALTPGYAGTLQVEYVAPWYWHLAECITLLSWGVVGVLALHHRKQRKARAVLSVQEG